MSLVDEEIERSVGGSGGGGYVGDDGDADEEEEGCGGSHNGRCRCRGEKSTKQRFYRSFGKAKQVVLQPFTRRQKANSCVFSSGKRFGGGVNGGGGNKGCYFCFTQPTTLGSPMGSRSSDPENPNFTSEMLRVFVEKNDFYSKECNHHHLDAGFCNYGHPNYN